MKKKVSILAWMAVVAICLSSCVSSKKIIYFQGSDDMFTEARDILQKYEMRIKPADQVYIKVGCDQPELLEMFSNTVVMGSSQNRSGLTSYMNSSLGSSYGYTVDNAGYVTLPVLERVYLRDLSCAEAAQVIEKRIQEMNLIKKPDVTVRLINARVAVLGAVRSPKVVDLTSERNSILDVLSQCGDVSDQGLRRYVYLFREENGKRNMYHLDLTQSDIFDSPAFYVQQNDLIYVQPNKSQNVRSSAFSTFLSTGASILGVISSVVALVIALSK